MTNIFVGNLDITATAQQLFAAHGAVEAITIVEERDTGERRGIAFVAFETAARPST